MAGTVEVSSSGTGTDVKAASTAAHNNCKALADTVCEGAVFVGCTKISDSVNPPVPPAKVGSITVNRVETWECP